MFSITNFVSQKLFFFILQGITLITKKSKTALFVETDSTEEKVRYLGS